MSPAREIGTATRTVRTDAGEMEVFSAWPGSASMPLPVVVVLMDMWGFRQAVKDIAQDIAALGYHALLPDLYHRTEPIRLDDETRGMAIRKFADIPGHVGKRMRAAMDGLADDAVVADVGALLKAAQAWPLPMARHVGLVGYCMGGRHALCVAGALPQQVRAAACLHGTGLVQGGERSPHRRALQARGEIYCGHAALDEYAPPEVPQQLAEALPLGDAAFSWQVHEGAHHGYALKDRGIYDAQATAHDWARIEAMFRRQLLMED
jgi:carboxymethylenebutenolidase